MTKYLLILLLFTGACTNSKISVSEIKTTEDTSSKESIFNDFIVALRDNDFSKLQPLMVKENEYLDYLQSLTTEKIDADKLGGSVADLYKFHISQTKSSFNRLNQKTAGSNINWKNASITDLKWENDGESLGKNARFTIKSEGEKISIIAKGMSKIKNSWRIGNTFLVTDK